MSDRRSPPKTQKIKTDTVSFIPDTPLIKANFRFEFLGIQHSKQPPWFREDCHEK